MHTLEKHIGPTEDPVMADSSAAAFTDDGGIHCFEWMQLPEQSWPEHGLLGTHTFSDSSAIPTSHSFCSMDGSSSSSSPTNLVSPSCNAAAGGCSSKPVRKLRGSKKMPTTLLKANANNFRELVQKFTGCPKKSSATSFNLDFKLGRIQSKNGSSNRASFYGEDRHQMAWPQQTAMHHTTLSLSSKEDDLLSSRSPVQLQIPCEEFCLDDLLYDEFSGISEEGYHLG